MDRRRFVVTAAVAGVALGTDACSSSLVRTIVGPQPGPVAPIDSYTLTAQYAVTTIQGIRMRTRTYGGRTYGPTLVTRPGHQLNIKVVNRLPKEPPAHAPRGRTSVADVHEEMQAMMPFEVARTGQRLSVGPIDEMNNPHGFNTTNIHVHGIQTVPHLFDPVGTSDPSAMMIQIHPGNELQYAFPIPTDHPSGLHWYHPHKHGSTDVQVSGGMAGLIVVRGPIDAVPEIAAAREIFLVIQSLNVNPSKTTPGLYEREYVAYKPPKEGGYSFGTAYTMLTVNGAGVNWMDNTGKSTVYHPFAPPSFAMRPGEVVRLRLLNGCNGIPLALVLPGFDCWQIGFDGVNLLAPKYKDLSGKNTPVVTPENMFTAPARLTMEANRIELLIRAPKKPGIYTLSSLPTQGIDFSAYAQLDLATFVVADNPIVMHIPKSLPVPTREYPIITDSEIVARRHFLFSQGPNDKLLMNFGFTINHALYQMAETPTTVKVGTAEEWVLENETVDAHPFHLHTDSFQIVALNGEPNDPPEVWDTFAIPPKYNGKNGSLTIRVRFLQFTGKDVFHCHILPHEDTGMMQNFLLS